MPQIGTTFAILPQEGERALRVREQPAGERLHRDEARRRAAHCSTSARSSSSERCAERVLQRVVEARLDRRAGDLPAVVRDADEADHALRLRASSSPA